MSSFLDQYESLDVIGNGSFGIIRKVRRKADGLIFARKELNFERMSERDRKQIVSEVNILKDLHHDHIVRYHDRYVDREAGILYILMEYCGGGDLSTIIKQAMRQNRPIPEDTIWNYFMQILQALHHCHHPNGHGRTPSSSGFGGTLETDGKDRRAQILHRDLKPDNVFLDENNIVKLGDFGLSKALSQASFANTYVGTPYYMSPELMQEKAYDSKSDIWSLGCLIYELCALKPPFHEAKTHSELSIFIRNGRIPPLPRGYSTALSGVIKAMLNLNPAMRPSAAQLLQHERLELVLKVTETEKMLSQVKAHKATVDSKERELVAREQALMAKEQHITALLAQKDHEIATLSQMQQHKQYTQHDLDVAIKRAVMEREDALRILVGQREAEVAAAMVKREEEIMEAVRRREAEVCHAWETREVETKKEVDVSIKAVEERVRWINVREEELRAEAERQEDVREELRELEEKLKKLEEGVTKGRKEKTPLEEVKNLLKPLAHMTQETPGQKRRLLSAPTPKAALFSPQPLETPITRPNYDAFLPSAMKGVVLTATGETLATPAPAEVANLFNNSPKVGLNFTKIFDFEDGDEHEQVHGEVNDPSPPPSPSSRKERERREKDNGDVSDAGSSSSNSTSSTAVQVPTSAAPPTRLRRPSIRASTRPSATRSNTLPASKSDPTGFTTSAVASSSSSSAAASSSQIRPKPLPHPHLHSTSSTTSSIGKNSIAVPPPVQRANTAPEYDLADEENLPSPFIKRGGIPPKAPASSSTNSSTTGTLRAKKRHSNGNMLRAVAAANNAGRRGMSPSTSAPDGLNVSLGSESAVDARPSLASARKASEEARKALGRP